MFVKKKNDISRYEFFVLLIILMVLVGMIKPFWNNYYQQKLQRLHMSDQQVFEYENDDPAVLMMNNRH